MAEADTPYARAEAAGRAALRRTLLDEAGRILVEQGPGALTVRKVAQAAGCSTTVLYTLFGGKDGLVDALYAEGFARLRAAMDAAATGGGPTGPTGGGPAGARRAGPAGPVERLRAMGHAYRAFARANPAYFWVMYGRAVPGEPPPAAADAQREVLGALAAAVGEAVAAGDVVTDDPTAVAEVLWAAAHGTVSLEMAGHLPSPEVAEARHDTLLVGALLPFLAGR